MKVTYTGKHALTPYQQKKLETRLSKFSKLADKGGEKEAHVVLTTERHLCQAEITLNFYDHRMVGVGSDSDTFTAITDAIDKLEKQVTKLRTKRRDTKRTTVAKTSSQTEAVAPGQEQPAAREEEEATTVVNVNVDHQKQRKPMTVEEALLEMEGKRDYMVYRDAGTGRVSVLIRRPDGNFDLIEA